MSTDFNSKTIYPTQTIQEKGQDFIKTLLDLSADYHFDNGYDLKEAELKSFMEKVVANKKTRARRFRQLLVSQTDFQSKKPNEKEPTNAELKNYLKGKILGIADNASISDRTLSNYISGETSPVRDNLFLISFALNLPFEEDEKIGQEPLGHKYLFQKVFGNRYCTRDPKELIFTYCKKTKKSYKDALLLMNQYKELEENSQCQAQQPLYTQQLLASIDTDQITDEDFLQLLVLNSSQIKYNCLSAMNKIADLVKEISDPDAYKRICTLISAVGYDSIWLYCRDANVMEACAFLKSFNPSIKDPIPTLIPENSFWEIPSQKTIKNCINGIGNTEPESIRKVLIILYFLRNWFDEDLSLDSPDQFIEKMNRTLKGCSMPILYPYEPFDLLIVASVKNAAANRISPLKYFYAISNIVFEDDFED